MLDKSDSNEVSNSKNPSKSFSVEMILDDFLFWFPRARDYGFTAEEIYETNENAVAVAIPIPILEDGNYKLWLFCFCRVERITSRGVKILIAELIRMFDAKLGYLIHFRHYYIIADRITKKIPPSCSKSKSVYVIKANYAFKVYEIIAKAVEGFVRSFRKNVKYGEDLLALCNELETFAERLGKRADELKSEVSKPISSTNNNSNSNKLGEAGIRKEVENYLDLLGRSEMIK